MANVLVVDDEAHLRVFVSAVFRSAGHETATARDGAQGLEKAREMQPDCISLDLMMPEQGGLKMLQGLKMDPTLARIPVLVLSAVSEPAFRHAVALVEAGLGRPLAECGAPVLHVHKPPTPQGLLDALARLLAG
ncbi:response regulator transcription factor [Megalodesulfovibrio gigas]|uniref:Putative response regulator receiver protein n=1 Tax=Megalodesulfovibrio gigas (strain ATCC 19364 / DSM 1382 / NCIMB 9332 / VKM B-1759) TaxID=1121448 RepID=T2GBH3_MEGG1|nr:response regulator [Megalodesulfovibrio gigas]AGW13524.1 putative response regulator receiver protein [Megalodesulfovibrio gigas DSM 1382 = ATCC 19364]